jgi:D-alanyl-D-alanine carboxypeptidase
MSVGTQTPARIVGMRLRPAQAPPPNGSPPQSSVRGEARALAALQAHLEAEAAADRFAGAVLVAKNGAVIFERAHGFADRQGRVANSTTTRFRVGSMNKMFTAVAILQLVEGGKVKLDDPLATFLPDYPNADLARRVTVDQLLTHRGGTGDIFVPAYFANKDNIRTLDDYIALLGSRAVAFPPGERFEYSNYGYILLGAVIERVTGRDYHGYVQSEIFDRAGMTRTGAEPEERPVEGLAVGYTRGGGEAAWRPNTAGLPYRATSAGGGYSTLRDLLAFTEALRALKLLGAEYTLRMLEGYGLRNMLADGSGFVGHNGGSPGMNGDLRIYPRSGYVTIALANLEPPAADAITELLDATLPVRP